MSLWWLYHGNRITFTCSRYANTILLFARPKEALLNAHCWTFLLFWFWPRREIFEKYWWVHFKVVFRMRSWRDEYMLPCWQGLKVELSCFFVFLTGWWGCFHMDADSQQVFLHGKTPNGSRHGLERFAQ